MPRSSRTLVTDPHYTVVVSAMVIGMMSLGVLLLSLLASHFASAFEFYYGTTEIGLADFTDGPFNASLLSIAVTAFLGTISFIALERRRARLRRQHHAHCVRRERDQYADRLSHVQRLEMLTHRTLLASGMLMLIWLLQTSYERYTNGLGWEALPYENWTSLLPLASILGLSIVVGAIVALISLFGLRTLVALHRAVTARFRRWMRSRQLAGRPGSTPWKPARELFGIYILSRPPPAAA